MEIRTARLYIRDLIEADWLPMHHLRTDPRVYRFNHFGPETESESRAWVVATMAHNNRRPRLSHNCAILIQATGQVIGWIGFGKPSAGKEIYGEISFGYALMPEFWGQGYMSEALQGMLAFIFTTEEASTVYADCNVGNIGSARVMEKAGMRRVARYQNLDELSPERAESYRYQIERGAWEEGSFKHT